MIDTKLYALNFPLPEDILKHKLAGDLDGAIRMIDRRLAKDIPDALRDRLIAEKAIIERLPFDYPYSRNEAIALMRELIQDFTEEEFDELELNGNLDYFYIDGERKYFKRFHKTLLKVNPEIRVRAGKTPEPESEHLNETVASVIRDGHQKWHIALRHTLKIDDNAFEQGETYRAHLPFPKPDVQVENIRVRKTNGNVGDEDQPQRTVYFERKSDKNEPFFVEYEYDIVTNYSESTAQTAYTNTLPVTEADLSPSEPHISFTPYLKSLTSEIIREETDDLKKARRIYDFVTTKVNYSFMRHYFLIENGSEYAASNLKGDCGIQALLFITMCRIAGIPARWQSGLYVEEGDVGMHDWALFYTKEKGWLFSDCSFGGSAWRNGNHMRWDFYFGNLDPFRMPANSEYYRPLIPAKKFSRVDPYDNQAGEIETTARGLSANEFDDFAEVLEMTRIE